MCPDIRTRHHVPTNNNISYRHSVRQDSIRFTQTIPVDTKSFSSNPCQFADKRTKQNKKGFYFFLRTLLRRGYHSSHFGYCFILHVCNTTVRSLFFIEGWLLRTVQQTSKIPAHFQQWFGFATKSAALACSMVFIILILNYLFYIYISIFNL